MQAHTEAMFDKMKSVGYDYVADGWFCVDAKDLRKTRITRHRNYRGLSNYQHNIIFIMDEILRTELTERRVPGQKFVLFHICSLDDFEDRWYKIKEFKKVDLQFGTFHAIPHYIEDGPNMSIKYTEQCSVCKEPLSTNLIGSMTLRYTLE